MTKLFDGFISYCEKEADVTDGRDLKLLDSFKPFPFGLSRSLGGTTLVGEEYL